jgi:hypothetical protein
MASTAIPVPTVKFRGPHLGFVALSFVALFVAALFPVTAFGGRPYFPGPAATVAEMVDFFSHRQAGVLFCAFLQFGSVIPLGIFTATAVSQLRFLGVRAAGTHIALFGGFLTATNIMITSSILWAMIYPGVPQDAALTQALYRVSFSLGGPGFSVPFGILLAGVSITAASIACCRSGSSSLASSSPSSASSAGSRYSTSAFSPSSRSPASPDTSG